MLLPCCKVSGCLLVCLNRATRLVKAQQSAGKECAYMQHFRWLSLMKAETTATSLKGDPSLAAQQGGVVMGDLRHHFWDRGTLL